MENLKKKFKNFKRIVQFEKIDLSSIRNKKETVKNSPKKCNYII
jgi:hypothetical protein